MWQRRDHACLAERRPECLQAPLLGEIVLVALGREAAARQVSTDVPRAVDLR